MFWLYAGKASLPRQKYLRRPKTRTRAFFTFQVMSWHPTRTASKVSLVTNENLGILLMIYFDAFINMKLQRTSLPVKREMTAPSMGLK